MTYIGKSAPLHGPALIFSAAQASPRWFISQKP